MSSLKDFLPSGVVRLREGYIDNTDQGGGLSVINHGYPDLTSVTDDLTTAVAMNGITSVADINNPSSWTTYTVNVAEPTLISPSASYLIRVLGTEQSVLCRLRAQILLDDNLVADIIVNTPVGGGSSSEYHYIYSSLVDAYLQWIPIMSSYKVRVARQGSFTETSRLYLSPLRMIGITGGI